MDIVIPNNNENEFISIAEKLGYKSLLFLYDFETYPEKQKNNETNDGIKIYNGILADVRNIQKINDRFKSKNIFIAVKSSLRDREIIEKSQANLLFSLEELGRKDFMHQRGSGLDHIMSKLAHKNKIIIGFSLNSVLNSDKKHIILGRIMQNIRLCRKYKVETLIGSFTSNPYEMRSPYDLISLFLSLGMTQKEAKDSFALKI